MQHPERIGKYELLEFLGGGMSHVYRARDTVLGRTVALKLLTEAGYKDEEAKSRFLQEAVLAANILHENIIGIYDFGEQNGRPFIVMEFLKGRDLRNAIASGEAGDLRNRLRIALQIASALEYIHQRGIVHRDIKPENIHLDDSGTAKLMDFGIAKTPGLSITQSGLGLGTPFYVSPEQIRGELITEKVDIYAFGILLFELLTGKKAVAGETVERLFYQILNEPLKTEPLTTAGVPRPVIDLVLRCAAKNPDERPANFEEIGLEITRVLRSVELEPPRATVITALPAPTEPSAPVLRRWILVLIGATAICILFTVPWLFLPKAAPPTASPPPPLGTTEPPIKAAWQLDGILKVIAAAVAVGIGIWLAIKLARKRVAKPTGSVSTPESKPTIAQQPAKAPEPGVGEFTRMFQTSPSPLAPPPVSVPAPAPVPHTGESTQFFQVPKASAPAGQAAAESTAPDVALTITGTVNVGLIGRRMRVDKFPFRIGRPGRELALSFDPAISRDHAEIDFVEGGFTIQDLGSSNGTFVHGKKLIPHEREPLLFGAPILLGSNTELTFVSADFDELPDLSGELVGGRYRLEENLSSSAKSAVYRARDEKLPESAVMVKILSPRLMRHPGYREEFDREAKTASRLQHPHITRVLDYGETELARADRTLYVASVFLEGGSLNRRLTGGPSSLEVIASWLDKIAGALDYVHTKGIVHGGIKPSAIVFDSHENPYLTDFAIAVSAEQKSRRTVIGSPAFMAPEQWEDSKLLPATDQYSLAALLYMLVAGARPFEGQEHPEVRRHNLLRGALPAHEMASRNGRAVLPPAVSKTLGRAMALKPEDRFPSVLAFSQAFRASLDERGIEPRPPLVFISYHRPESAMLALLLKDEVEKQCRCEVFVDTEQRDRAGQFPARIQRKIDHCDVFVCLLAKNSLQAEWVNHEIELAHAGGKPMVPVFQEKFKFPKKRDGLPKHVQELLNFQGETLLDVQNKYVREGIKSVTENIRQLLPRGAERIQ